MNDTAPDAAKPADIEQTEQSSAPAPAPSPQPASAGPRLYPASGFHSLYWGYFGCAVGGMVLTVTIILSFLGFPALIIAAVFAAIFIYRSWAQVQDHEARTTPGLAVGLMFVPLFNLYWAYIAIWGLAKDLNSYTRRNGIEAPQVNEGLALGLCVMMSLGLIYMFIPIVNILAWLATTVIALIVMNDFRKASMAIATAG